MPPLAKFTEEQIVEAGLSIFREGGMEALSARKLANVLQCSPCPIFTVFKNMDAVREATYMAARGIYNEYLKRGLGNENAFRGAGAAYIRFALDEPKLFQILFMTEFEELPKNLNLLERLDDNWSVLVKTVEKQYGLNTQDAYALYNHLFIYAHGIATLCATKVCTFTQDEIEENITEVCRGLLGRIKAVK